MADQPGGIDVMRRRIERARRQAPPSRRTREGEGEGEGTPAPVALAAPVEAPTAPAPPAEEPPSPVRRSPRPRASRPAAVADPVRLSPDTPPVNLAIRVRRPLDDRLAETIHQLRRAGVRTSKVELIEMLLWEMPEDDARAVRERLRRFRDWAPRGTGAPIGEAAG